MLRCPQCDERIMIQINANETIYECINSRCDFKYIEVDEDE